MNFWKAAPPPFRFSTGCPGGPRYIAKYLPLWKIFSPSVLSIGGGNAGSGDMRLDIVFHRVSPVSSTFFHNEAPCKGPTRSKGSWLKARFTVRKSKKKKAAAHNVVSALL